MASIILKAAEVRNHETSAFRSLRLVEAAPFLPHLLHPDFFKKTFASAERADKKRLPTDHDANLHQKCKFQDAPVMILML